VSRERRYPTEAAVIRAIKAASNAGIRIGRVDIRPDGTISILTVDAAPALSGTSELNEWDEVLSHK
jgi:hypothetical protein